MASEAAGFRTEERADGVSIVSYEGDEPELAIPAAIGGAPVVLIAARAFEGNANLQAVEVPESVTFIGNYAFSSCPMLERVVVRARIEALNLGTFWNCPSLVDVQLPDSLASINDGAFRNCTALKSLDVPAGVTFIGDSVFRECTALEAIVLDGGIRTIERSAFRGCTSLRTVAISTTLEYLGTRTFQDCPSLESVTLLGPNPDATLAAFANHGFTPLVADCAVERGTVSFDEAKALLNSKQPLEQLLAARVLAATPERLGEVFSKQKLALVLASAGRTAELRILEECDMLTESGVQACIEAATQAGHAEAAAYLLDALSRLRQGSAPAQGSGLRL